jgi:hypothetical protein
MANPGPVPPEVESQAQEAFFALQIPGKLKVEAFGEYSCDHFGVEEIDYNYTLFVSDLSDQAALSALVSKVKDSAKNSLKGYNLGTISVLFQSGKECWWEEQQNACGTIGPISH